MGRHHDNLRRDRTGKQWPRTPLGLGRAHPRAFRIWNAMRARCSSPRHARYADYGGRGIRVCDRWQAFSAFLADMGDPPPGCSIDRIDNGADYGPGNCRWATAAEQNLNTRRNVVITYDGVTLTATEWAARIGIPPKTLRQRIYRGATPEQAVAQGKGLFS